MKSYKLNSINNNIEGKNYDELALIKKALEDSLAPKYKKLLQPIHKLRHSIESKVDKHFLEPASFAIIIGAMLPFVLKEYFLEKFKNNKIKNEPLQHKDSNSSYSVGYIVAKEFEPVMREIQLEEWKKEMIAKIKPMIGKALKKGIQEIQIAT